MPGTLYVVATPIGNLEDITLRALRVLREADLIAAEDTRRTAKLLTHHGIDTRTISFHEHNARSRVPQLTERIAAGQSVALVSDAGTPGVSDPGVELIDECIARGFAVDPIPGASAPLAAAVASGFPVIPLTIFGFVPHRSKDRTGWLQAASLTEGTFTFFESPQRICETLGAAAPILVNRPMMLARELTKLHQELLRGTAATIARGLREPVKGEITVVVGPLTKGNATEPPSEEAIVRAFSQLTGSSGLNRRSATTAVAKQLGVSSRTVYAAVERHKHSVERQNVMPDRVK